MYHLFAPYMAGVPAEDVSEDSYTVDAVVVASDSGRARASVDTCSRNVVAVALGLAGAASVGYVVAVFCL